MRFYVQRGRVLSCDRECVLLLRFVCGMVQKLCFSVFVWSRLVVCGAVVAGGCAVFSVTLCSLWSEACGSAVIVVVLYSLGSGSLSLKPSAAFLWAFARIKIALRVQGPK